MSASHRQAKKRLAGLAAQRAEVEELNVAYTLVRAHLKITSAQSIAQAHDEVRVQLANIDGLIALVKPQTADNPRYRLPRSRA